MAEVQKIPTPIKRIGEIKGKGTFRACYDKKSTVDYIGTFKGRTIVFDAKETSIETRFPLKNIKKHQYQYMVRQHNHGAIAFLIVRFKSRNEDYLLPVSHLQKVWSQSKNGGRKSIPYDSFHESFKIEKGKGRAIVDYLSVIDFAGVI